MENYDALIKRNRAWQIIKRVIIYTLLVIWALAVLFPFYWMILTSFKEFRSYSQETVPLLYANPITFENYSTAWISGNLLRVTFNTIIYAVSTTTIMVVVSILAAYAFARLNFKGKDLVFTIFLAVMMIPTELVIITNYTTTVNLDWRNTFVGLIMPTILSVFYIYLLRQNFMQIPDNLYYAAKVDGVGDFKYLLKVVIPLSKPTIISIAVLKLIECWNSYVWPKLISTDKDYYLVSNAIQDIRSTGFGKDNTPAMMAAVVSVSIPLLLIFAFFRDQIMTGVSKTGTKG